MAQALLYQLFQFFPAAVQSCFISFFLLHYCGSFRLYFEIQICTCNDTLKEQIYICCLRDQYKYIFDDIMISQSYLSLYIYIRKHCIYSILHTLHGCRYQGRQQRTNIIMKLDLGLRSYRSLNTTAQSRIALIYIPEHTGPIQDCAHIYP